MTRVEVLAPLRLETRFVKDEAGNWVLHLRVFPDDFALARPPAPPTKVELDVLEDALASILGDAADARAASDAAFRSAAALLGGQRTWWLWRTATKVGPDVAGNVRRRVDRSAQSVAQQIPGKPLGLPDALDVWMVFGDTPTLMETLHPDHDKILADLEVDAFTPAGRHLPSLWWLNYQRAQDVGLAVPIPLTSAQTNSLDLLVVVGSGQTPAMELLTAHAESGNLAALAQGTATNTVAGAPAAPLGDDAETWLPLLDSTAADQPGTTSILRAFGEAAGLSDRPPIPGGQIEHTSVARLSVQGLWPVLWGRTIRDIVGTPLTSSTEPELARWATDWLAVQGPWPAIRVVDQPYGLIPTSDFGTLDPANPGSVDVRWRPDSAETPGTAELEQAVLSWALSWRQGAAQAAAGSTFLPGSSPAVGATAEQMLGLYGRHAPSEYWRLRAVADLPLLQATQIAQSLPVSHLTSYDQRTAAAWHGFPLPYAPIAAAGSRRHLPGPPRDAREDVDQLWRMLDENPESLWSTDERELGLFGHLLRESLIAARATIGRAWLDLQIPTGIEPSRRIPLDADFPNVVMHGTDSNLADVRVADPGGEVVADRFEEVRSALYELIGHFADQPEPTLRIIKATLDAASFRMDPWLMGVAQQRVERMAVTGAPFLLGAYGWVDRPRPWVPEQSAQLPPGPTEVGLLHAPSFAQVQMAAVLRDAAVRNSADSRWDITLTSDRVRAAVALGERVRGGVHLFEALGLEVEALAGNPDVVRILRREFPTTPEEPAGAGGAAQPNDPTRRVCDGLAVLAVAKSGPLPAGVPVELGATLAPLHEVLDTYADLLLVDGVHALVTRSPEAGGAAMEAAAGLGLPPELRGIRTPREASTVSVACWVVLGAGVESPVEDPVAIADPAFVELVGTNVADDPNDPAVLRAVRLVGGSEAVNAPTNEPPGLVPAMVADLSGRWVRLLDVAQQAFNLVADLGNPASAATVERLDRQWRLGLRVEQPDWTTKDRREEAAEILSARLKRMEGAPPTALAGLQTGIRALVGRPDLPVLAVVDRSRLPAWAATPSGLLDSTWLEIVAAVHSRLAPLEAYQLTAADPWPASLQAADGNVWSRSGSVHVAYGSGLTGGQARVAVALLDRWVDSIPSQHHVTHAAFGFNAPKTRAPNAVLLAVPPDPDSPLEGESLFNVVTQVRELALARAARPTDRAGLPWATPSPVVQVAQPMDFRRGWR